MLDTTMPGRQVANDWCCSSEETTTLFCTPIGRATLQKSGISWENSTENSQADEQPTRRRLLVNRSYRLLSKGPRRAPRLLATGELMVALLTVTLPGVNWKLAVVG